MSARTFCIPSVAILFVTFILSLIVSISLPSLPALEITRTTFAHGNGQPANAIAMQELRLGIWAYCVYDLEGSRTCIAPGHGYSVQVGTVTGQIVTITGAWTRGLAVHPVATGVVFLAFLASCSTHLTAMLAASILSFLAAFLTLIAFAIDIALYVHVHNTLNDLKQTLPSTNAGAGFWITMITIILLLVSGCTVCFGRRRATRSPFDDPSGSGFNLRRIFRRNY